MSTATIRVRYPARKDALACYRASRDALTLFAPSDETVETGRQVRLLVTFGDAPEIFELEGRVAWRIEPRQPGQPAGLAVTFLAPERTRASRMLAFCAGRPLTAASHVEDRVPAQLPVVVQQGAARVSAYVRDLSASGVFVASEALSALSPGSEVVIQLTRGWLGLGARRIKASVVWRGMKYGVRGFGARFVEGPERARPVLRRYLRTKPR